jgi:sugar phosphate isomerase/epimerase
MAAMPRLMIGGPLWCATGDPKELAQMHVAAGYRAAYCPDVALSDTHAVAAAREAYAAAGLVIAEVGAWVNLLDPDPRKRAANLTFVQDRLALADEIGALCCVDIVGSFNPDQWDGPHPDNMGPICFEAAVENARAVIDAVKPKRAKFSYEMMPHTVPHGPDSFLSLLRAVDREAFGVHLDPVNIVNSPERYFANADLIRECFRKLGPWIVSCHAKDTLLSPDLTVHISEVRPGLGYLDYRAYLSEIAALPTVPPLMLEHLATEDEYAASRAHLFAVADGMGLAR